VTILLPEEMTANGQARTETLHPSKAMTQVDPRIDQLEKRVEKIEDTISVKLQHIFEALEELRASGIGPGKDLEHAITAHNSTMLRVERLELKILDMERQAVNESRATERQFAKIDRQKAWVLGAWSAVAFFASAFGAVVTIALKTWIK
jgi:hypothetical protein